MSKVKILMAVLAAVGVAIGVGVDMSKGDSLTRTLWQQAVIPKALSQSHASLSGNCAACHTPVKGVEPALCISCHAYDTALLQRQPTAFHATVQVCSGCHVEHQETARMATTMDHALLARAGHREIEGDGAGSGLNRASVQGAPGELEAMPVREGSGLPPAEASGAREPAAGHPLSAASESMLNCANCHASKDRHQGMLGADCVQCHATTRWTVAEFRHPSSRSTECSQCHQPPPSHRMMHFSMMSAPLARQPGAEVNQCFLCHQTTAWNDIKGVGWKKVH